MIVLSRVVREGSSEEATFVQKTGWSKEVIQARPGITF